MLNTMKSFNEDGTIHGVPTCQPGRVRSVVRMNEACSMSIKFTFGSERAAISHIYMFLSSQPVTSRFPSTENDTQFTFSGCWRDGLMGCPLSRFHSRAVLSYEMLAKMRS
jgi:hypothetical protein